MSYYILYIENYLTTVWGLFDFARRYFRRLFDRPFEFNETVKQCFEVGNKSLPLVTVTGFITGFVLALQAYPTLSKFGAQSLIPAMISIGIVREIGPVITGLICAGKIGSGIPAAI